MPEQLEKKFKEARTQILITDIPKIKFDSKWPEDLEKELFEREFVDLKRKLQYYTPLAFLNRIVIIFDDEAAAETVYEYLKDRLRNFSYRIYLAESLLAKPRAKSMDDAEESDSPGGESQNHCKPVLSINTYRSTGASSLSLSLGSPSLSPEKNSLDSPTLLKFDSQSKAHYYQEPLPRSDRGSSLTSFSSCTDVPKYLYKPEPSPMTTTSSGGLASSISSDDKIPPPSPSITLKEFPR
ncbi:hypothetical protein HG536_0A07410 [Torulaspora globosa]|uniref:Uncharacterized protein n=1 Tax=Torulaspora globosa TaxID=48254 RepID=A0A7G3ZBP0_9SACH|nr:uncharacterized protein HG536_0A07410 [Torulaspora globosa]QLL30926.1 hypothetical protein HG536_0A07410 [Torulaspora globosa]